MRQALILALLICSASFASAENLVQLTLSGEIVASGGARVELAVGALRAEDEAREVTLDVHLAESTTASDVVGLLAARVQAAGFMAFASEPVEMEGVLRRHLFIENTLFVRARLGFGLEGTLTSCEGAPAEIRLISAEASKAEAVLYVHASTLHPHTEQLGRAELEMALESGLHAAIASERLFRHGMEHDWIAERISPTGWSPTKLSGGARFTGLSVRLETTGDWGLELDLRQ